MDGGFAGHTVVRARSGKWEFVVVDLDHLCLPVDFCAENDMAHALQEEVLLGFAVWFVWHLKEVIGAGDVDGEFVAAGLGLCGCEGSVEFGRRDELECWLWGWCR